VSNTQGKPQSQVGSAGPLPVFDAGPEIGNRMGTQKFAGEKSCYPPMQQLELRFREHGERQAANELVTAKDCIAHKTGNPGPLQFSDLLHEIYLTHSQQTAKPARRSQSTE
jgi:hypothetical protein